MWEVEFKYVESSEHDRRKFQTHRAAREFAEAMPVSTGWFASVRRDRSSRWDIFIMPMDRLQVPHLQTRCMFADAVRFQVMFDNAAHQAVVVFCPEGLKVSWPTARTA